jgi:hypothetical protein
VNIYLDIVVASTDAVLFCSVLAVCVWCSHLQMAMPPANSAVDSNPPPVPVGIEMGAAHMVGTTTKGAHRPPVWFLARFGASRVDVRNTGRKVTDHCTVLEREI